MINTEAVITYFNKPGGKVTLGIDGYVDEVWQIVANRKNETEYALYDSLKNFAKSVYDSGTGGYTSEIIRKRRRYGGFTANTGKAAGSLGCELTMIGAFGKDRLDLAFKEFQEKHKVVSICDPGVCEIFEFSDGKLMLPFTEEASGVNWDQLVNAVPAETLSEACGGADIIGLGYWLLLRNFDDIITKIYERFLPSGKEMRVFFDFADIRKRDKQTLFDTLALLAKLNKQTPATLSLNEHEAACLFSYAGKDFSIEYPKNADRDIESVRRMTGLDELIVHTPHFAAGASASQGSAVVLQEFCESPVITAGAGDNFNGGYIAASARKGELALKERLFVANIVTGFYVRNGRSPQRADLLAELSKGESKWV